MSLPSPKSASAPGSGLRPASPELLHGLDAATADPALGPIVVQKYGGSSVADPERLRQVAAHVAETVRSGRRVVVVVSAMGKTTDQLIGLARGVTQSPPRRELDMLLSSGERISMALLAMALHDLGLDAISFTGSQSGILTNDRHSGARIIEVRPVRIQDELERGRVVIVAGFQGMSYKREVTTLGRGGSDTTAVALAAALGAESCEIYSDVDGVYSADPRVVASAQHLPSIEYAQMQELAEHGAKVLNAQAVEWAQRAGIVLSARKTGGAPRETRIGAAAALDKAQANGPGAGERGRATAVTGCAQVVLVRASQRGAEVLAALGAEGAALRQVDLQHTPGGDTTLEATLVRDDLPDWPRTLAALAAAAHGGLTIDDAHGAVTAVGPGLGSDPQLAVRVHAGLVEHGLHPGRAVASPLRLTLYLPSPEVAAATRLVHDWLCAPGPARAPA